MYSVFLADREIEILKISQSVEFENVIQAEPNKAFPFWDHFLKFLSEKPGKKLRFASSDPDWLFRYVTSFFIKAEAAGGLVINDRKQLLFIFRLGKWDLPKGHGEPGETLSQTALREVSEETGVDGLEIIAALPDTFHIFETGYRQFVIKKTWWYLMQTSSQKKPKPQLNENITRAEWISLEQLNAVFENTFGSVKLVLNHALDHNLLNFGKDKENRVGTGL